MSTGSSKTRLGIATLGLVFLLLSIFAWADLDGVTLNTPVNNANVSGNQLLNATTNGWALNTTFYWSNDTGNTWYEIITIDNTTPSQSEFTYLWDSSGVSDGTGLHFNATSRNGTFTVSDSNTGITIDNTPPIIVINLPQNNSAVHSAVATLNVTLNEANPSVSLWEVDSNGTNITGCVGCTEFENETSSLGDGQHNITVYSNDTLGNTNSTTVFFHIATTPVIVNVKDSESGDDIQNAVINFTSSLVNISNTTDSNGNATLRVDTALLYDIIVDLDGYAQNTSLTSQNFTSTQEVPIVLSGNSTIDGYVREIGSGLPISATVSVYDNSTDTIIYQTQSSPTTGYYSLSVPGDLTYYVNFTSTGFVSTQSNVFTGPNTISTEMYQDGYGSFTFNVEDTWNGRPVPNTDIYVEIGGYNETGTTNSSGIVIITVPSGGSYNIYAESSGYMSNNSLTGLSVSEGSNNNIEMKMRGDSKIYGYVRDSESSSGVGGAFLELWDENNTQKLGWSSYYYNDTSLQSGYYEIYYPSTLSSLTVYVHTSLSGYNSTEISSGGTQRTDINLLGTAITTGKVVDSGNNSVGINSANVRLLNATTGETLYQKNTDSNGNFSIRPRDGANYTLRITKSGYNPYTDTTPYTTSHDYGIIEMEGTANVVGKVIDYQNNTINILGATVRMVSGSLSYQTTTDSSGDFALNVSPGYTYTITITKSGYSQYTDYEYVNGYENLGNIYMTGSQKVNGTVRDSTRYYPWDQELEDVNVKLEGSGNTYSTATDSNGFYSMYIPSNILSYTITFTRDGFKQKTISRDGDVELVGSTHVDGYVYDEYNDEKLPGADLFFYDDEMDIYYVIEANASGYYSIDLGLDTNYFIYAHDSGYDYKMFGFTDTIGFPYDIGDTGAWDRTENIGLVGDSRIYIRTLDGFSGDPVPNSHVCLKKEGEQDCFYSGVTSQNGEFVFFAESNNYYDMSINSEGYPSQEIFDSNYITSSGYSNTIDLNAYAKIHVYDQYAEESMKDIFNANTSLYYYNDQTDFNYTLNRTKVNITTTCNFLQRDDIQVTMNGETKTTSGENVVTFDLVPTGNYIVEINGSSAGCGLQTQRLNINQGGRNLTFPENYTAYNLNPTNLIVKIQRPNGTGIEGATVFANSSSNDYVANETGSGIYNFTYIQKGVYNVSATFTDYNYNSTNYTVAVGCSNDYTGTPLVLKPESGNLSIYVQNSTSPLDGISVILDNGTEYSSSTSGGWANFTDVVGVYSIKVNGTNHGYKYNHTENYLVEPNQENIVSVELETTWMSFEISNFTGTVGGVNITFYNGSSIAQSATGSSLTGITNSSGNLTFYRIKAGNYTVNITKENYTEMSFNFIRKWKNFKGISLELTLNITGLIVVVNDYNYNPLEDIDVNLENSTFGYENTEQTRLDGIAEFNYLYIYPAGKYNLTVDGGGEGYGIENRFVNILDNSLNWEDFRIDKNKINITVNDSMGYKVEDGVFVEIGSISNTTESGMAELYLAPTGTNTLIVNGSRQGYGVNSTSISLNHESNSVSSILQVTRLIVHVQNSTNHSVSGADVRVLNGTTYQLEDNGKSVYMNGTTDSNGNITFYYVPTGTYKIVVEDGSLENYTFYTLNSSFAGETDSLTLHITQPTTETFDSGDISKERLTFMVMNKTNSSIENVTIRIRNRTDDSLVANALTNSTGQAVLYVEVDNIYNFEIDGEAIGYSKIMNYSVPIGETGVSEEYSDNSGIVNLNINGRRDFKIRIENAYGYYDYDDNNTNISRRGTYDDAISSNPYVNPSIQIPMTGVTNLTGTVYDANFVNPVDLDYEPVESMIYIYASPGCLGTVRYSTSTEENGTYSKYISPKQLGSNTDMSYCMKVVKTGYDDGYEYTKTFSTGAEEVNFSMQGEGRVSGTVREIITEKILEGANVSLRSKTCYGGYSNCEAYRDQTSGGMFSFNVSSHPNYYPYDIVINKTNYFSLGYNNSIYPNNSSLSYHMIPLGKSVLNLNITGSEITSDVEIKWGSEKYSSSNESCVQDGNILTCLLRSGGRLLTVNGSSVGYGVYQEWRNLVQGQNYSIGIRLNKTNVNISIINQNGEDLNDIVVKLGDYQDTTVNGTVIFERVPGGDYNITFSGDLTEIYGINNSNNTQITVLPGLNNTYQFTFNETQFLVLIRNESSVGIGNVTVYMNGSESFQNTTNSSGIIIFRQVPFGNYTIEFNDTEIREIGYITDSSEVYATLGADWNNGNNITFTLSDVEVWFNISNSTSSLQNINLTMFENNSIAQNGRGNLLTGLTNSSGIEVFHNVVPSGMGNNYTFMIDGNSTGYGIYENSLQVGYSGTNVTAELVPLTLNVFVKDQSSNNVTANVTLYRNGQMASNVKSENMTANSTSGIATFTHLYSGTYNVTVSRSGYSTYSQNHILNFSSNSINVSITDQSSTTTTTTDTTTTTGGGSGGGGGSSSREVEIAIEDETVDITGVYVSSGDSKIIEISDWSGLVYKLMLKASQTIRNARIKIESMNPWDIFEVPKFSGEGIVKDYLRFTTEGIEGKTQSVSVYFKVDKKWMEDNSIGEVSLWRYDHGWKELETSNIGQTDDGINFKSTFDGFSYFVIVGQVSDEPLYTTTTVLPIPDDEHVCGDGICETGEDCPSDCDTEPMEGFNPIFIIIPVLFGAAIVAFIYFKKKEPKQKEPEIKRLPPPPDPITRIKDIAEDPERYIGENVMIEGDIKSSEFLPKLNRVLYKIEDSTGEMEGISRHAGHKGSGTIEGTIIKKGRNIYLEF